MKERLASKTAAVAAAAAAAATSQAAHAADWSGPYVGGTAGVNFLTSDPSSSSASFNYTGAGAHPGTESAQNAAVTNPVVGLNGGWNWQRDRLVYGGELGASWLGAQSAKSSGSANFSYTGSGTYTGRSSRSTKTQAAITVRGRVGEDFDGTLPYLAAGFALARQKSAVSVNVTTPGGGAYGPFSASKNDWRPGFTVAAGVEQQIAPGWSFRGEVSWMDFGTQHVGNPFTKVGAYSGSGSFNFHSSITTVSLGLNYRF